MIKFIRYHLLYLFNNLWIIFIFLIMLISGLMFYYLGGGFDSSSLRLLELNTYLIELEHEAFLICNIALSVWIIGASKEIFLLEEDYIMIINKKRYIKSKIIAYLIYYLFIGLLLFGSYQVICFILYGPVKFNYKFLINLMINISLIHFIVVLTMGKNKNILITIIYLFIYIMLFNLLNISFLYKDYIFMFIPLLNLSYPNNGYIHTLLIIYLLYFLSYYKHITSYE